MSQPNPSAELEELIAETRAQAILETVERCMEICYKRGDTYAFAGQQRSAAVCDVCAKDISADFLSKEDGK